MTKKWRFRVLPVALALLAASCQVQQPSSPVTSVSQVPVQSQATAEASERKDPFESVEVTYTPKEPAGTRTNLDPLGQWLPIRFEKSVQPVVVGFGLEDAQGLNNYRLEAGDPDFFEAALKLAFQNPASPSVQEQDQKQISDANLYFYFKNRVLQPGVRNELPHFETYALKFALPKEDLGPLQVYALGYNELKQNQEYKLINGPGMTGYPLHTWLTEVLKPRLKNRHPVSHTVRTLPPPSFQLVDPTRLDEEKKEPLTLGSLLAQTPQIAEVDGLALSDGQQRWDRPQTQEISEALQALLNLEIEPANPLNEEEEETPVLYLHFLASERKDPYRPGMNPNYKLTVTLKVIGSLENPRVNITVVRSNRPFQPGAFELFTVTPHVSEPGQALLLKKEAPTQVWGIKGLKEWHLKWGESIKAAYPGFSS